MKKLLLNLFCLFFISSCYETQIDTEAVIYDKDTNIIEVNFHAFSNTLSENHYFGLNNTQSTVESSVTPYIMTQDTCLISYKATITSSSATGVNGISLSINSSIASDITIALSNSEIGVKETLTNKNVNAGDSFKFVLLGSAMTTTFSADIQLKFGSCQ